MADRSVSRMQGKKKELYFFRSRKGISRDWEKLTAARVRPYKREQRQERSRHDRPAYAHWLLSGRASRWLWGPLPYRIATACKTADKAVALGSSIASAPLNRRWPWHACANSRKSQKGKRDKRRERNLKTKRNTGEGESEGKGEAFRVTQKNIREIFV